MRDIYGATADAPRLPRRLRPLAPRALVRRHRGDAPPLPRVTGAPHRPRHLRLRRRARRQRADRAAPAPRHPRRRRRRARPPPRPTRSSSAARSPPPARSSPATTASPSPTPPSTTCAARLYAAFRAELQPIPAHRRHPRRAALPLLRRLLLAARAHRALARPSPASGRASPAAPSPRPWSPTASPPPTSSCTPPGPSATLPPPAWSSRTARPASWRPRPRACGWWPSPGEAMPRAEEHRARVAALRPDAVIDDMRALPDLVRGADPVRQVRVTPRGQPAAPRARR